jgi:hypothetical protein
VKVEPVRGLERVPFVRKLAAAERRDLRLFADELHAEEEWDVPTFLRKQAD